MNEKGKRRTPDLFDNRQKTAQVYSLWPSSFEEGVTEKQRERRTFRRSRDHLYRDCENRGSSLRSQGREGKRDALRERLERGEKDRKLLRRLPRFRR